MLRTAMVLGLWWACALWASAAVPETPRFRIIGPAQGLPSTDIKALARDRTGYLWIATADGLARYDGSGMRVWRHDPANPQSLAGNNVQALHVDRRDRVWIAVEGGGISMLDAQRRSWRHYRRSEYPQIASDDTWAFASAGDALWFGTYDGGLHRLDADGRITRYAFDERSSSGLPSNTIMALAFDVHGVLWIATDAGLARFDGHGIERVPLPGDDPAPLVFSLTREGDAVWIGSATGVLRRHGNGTWSRPPWSVMFERPNAMMAIARDSDASYWIASQRGLWRMRGREAPAPVELGGPGIVKAIQTMLLQPDGALWVPVAGAGLGYLRSDWRRVAQYAQSPTGLAGDMYRGLAPARRGGLWLGGYNGAIERLDVAGHLERLDDAERARMQGMKIVSVVEDDGGRLWVGHRTGLIRISREDTVDEWDDADASEATPPGQIDQLRIAPDGNLWLSSQGGGIQQRDPATGKVLTAVLAGEAGGLGLADTEAMEFAPDGSLWIAGAQGLSRYDPDRQRFSVVDATRGGRVFAFAFDGNGALWLQRLSGLERFECTPSGWRRTATLAGSEGLPAVGAAGLRIDRRHRLWLSTARGLFRWD
ncbi:MAG: hybrid sensor histidine kinase/response regulator, partial [Gammaproteobacteria bacterium]|nr:hybrid sensor histidine kinase/response regulator [Gammaproteobacteria bacterium]